MRLIPGKTKVQIELFKGISLWDVVIGGIALAMLLLAVLSSLPFKLAFCIAIIVIAALLLIRLDTEPNYVMVMNIIKHLAYKRNYERVYDDAGLLSKEDGSVKDDFIDQYREKIEETKEEEKKAEEKKAEPEISEKELIKRENKILKSKTATEEEKDAVWLARAQRSAAKKEAKKTAKREKQNNLNYAFMEDIIAFTGIKDNLIEYGGKYYGAAIEIEPVEFRFFSEHRRVNSIELGVGRVLRSIHAGFAANIVKLERPIIYDNYLKKEEEKLEQIRRSYESGMMSEDELKARVEIENDRLNELKHLCTDNQVVVPFYYIVLFESDKKQLELQVEAAIDSLQKGELIVHRLDTKELAVFLKYTNQIDFDEREIDKYKPEDYTQWAMPQRVNIKYRTVEVNDIITHNFRVVRYPAWVDDAWLANVLAISATKVVVKCMPMDRSKAIRTIDRSLQELRGQYNATGVDSRRIELEGHIDTLSGLLTTLQGEGEELLECNIYVTAYDARQTRLAKALEEMPTLLSDISGLKKTVRRTWQESNFRLNDMFFDQTNAFIGSQISAYDPEIKQGRGIPSNSLAAAYPWIFAHISDEGGFKLGNSQGVPVFINFFRRDSERVNSNMVIIGKSGSGKSYATKSILSNLASEDAKIFILDPENEYSELAENLHGKVINVANAKYGRLNPFHIITALDDDETGSAAGSFSTHLQFLEEFYRQILPDIDKDALEYLNNLTERLYVNRDITPETDLSLLRPEDYPIFDDLYDMVLEEFERTDNDYIRSILRTLINYVAKFSADGRNANIWNGPSTVTTDENFTVFNFQAMLSNRNTTIANAQMLLVLKYIDNEIIKNRDYNAKYKLNRKVVVVVDEAHVFIDTKFPIALDFMFQLAKRIRKYNGMQIIITQNIKDFVGSEEIARKSTAIINACQYSFIFALAPNDMHDLCKLYEKAGGISENEQEQIIQAPRGQAFTVMSATSRSTFKVEVPRNVVDMFQDRDFVSSYFTGTDGTAAWERFVSASRELHDINSRSNKTALTVVRDDEDKSAAEKKKRLTFEEITEEPQDIVHIPMKKAKKADTGKKRIAFEEVTEEPDLAGLASKDDDFGMSDEELDAIIEKNMELKRVERKAPAVAAEEKTARVQVEAMPVIQAENRAVQAIQLAVEGIQQAAQLMAQANARPVPVAVPDRAVIDYESIAEQVRRKVLAELAGELGTEGLAERAGEELYPEDEYAEGFDDIETEDEIDDDEEIEIDSEPEDYEELPEEGAEEELEIDPDEDNEEAYQDDGYDFNSMFITGDSDAEQPDESLSVEDLEEPASDDDSDGGFDVMAMLRARAAKALEEKTAEMPKYEDLELDDYVEDGGVADITGAELDELIELMRRKHRR